MLKWILGIALWLTVTAKLKQPHILYIVTDDMGWSDIGFPEGNKESIPILQLLLCRPRGVKVVCLVSRPSGGSSELAGAMGINLVIQIILKGQRANAHLHFRVLISTFTVFYYTTTCISSE